MQRRALMKFAALLSSGLFSAGASAEGIARPARAILLTGGNYIRYRRILLNFALGLEKLGLIEHIPTGLDDTRIDTADVWASLAKTSGGTMIDFLEDGHYSYNFDTTLREPVLYSLLKRIREKKDVDIIFAFGTEPTLDLKAAVKDIPIVSLGSTDPVSSGISETAEFSGQDNLHAIVLEDFFSWQVQVFYAVRPFKKLGLISAEERDSKSGEPEIREAAQKLGAGFAYVTYKEDSENPSDNFQAYKTGVEELIDEGCDAVMLPWFPCNEEEFPQIVELLTKNSIMSFSLTGLDAVSRGILLGVGEENLEGYGLYEADVTARILDGETPGSISQRFVQQNRLAVNLMTAMQMGWKVPFGLLISVEKAYTTHSPQFNAELPGTQNN